MGWGGMSAEGAVRAAPLVAPTPLSHDATSSSLLSLLSVLPLLPHPLTQAIAVVHRGVVLHG